MKSQTDMQIKLMLLEIFTRKRLAVWLTVALSCLIQVIHLAFQRTN
jgi:hypothetical protein